MGRKRTALVGPVTNKRKDKSTFLDDVNIEDQIFLAVVGGRIFFHSPFRECSSFAENDNDGRFWLAVVMEEPQSPQSKPF